MEINNYQEMMDFVHEKLYDQLNEIDRICRKNKIKYTLHGGTLLGAVRHKGFIPWDDDADIAMDRENLNMFLKVFNKEMSTKYILTRELWMYKVEESVDIVYFGKHINRIYTDILVFDKTTSNKIIFTAHVLAIKILQGMIKDIRSLTWKNRSISQNIAQLITFLFGIPFSHKHKMKWYDKVAILYYKKKNWKYVFASNDEYKDINKRFSFSSIESYKSVKFNESQFMILEGYNEILSKLYGKSYMEFPPIEMQKPSHYVKQ